MLIKQRGLNAARKEFVWERDKDEAFAMGFREGYFTAKNEALAILKEQLGCHEKSGVQYSPADALGALYVCIESYMCDWLNVYFLGTEGEMVHSFRCSNKQEACEKMSKWLHGTCGEMKLCTVVPDGFKVGDALSMEEEV